MLTNPTKWDIRLFSAIVITTLLRLVVIALNNFIRQSHCQVMQLFRIKSLLIKAVITIRTAARGEGNRKFDPNFSKTYVVFRWNIKSQSSCPDRKYEVVCGPDHNHN